MPFKSKAQQRFMFAAEAQGKLKPGTARKWAHETKDMKKLPEHVKKAAFEAAFFDELDKLAAKTVVSDGRIKRVVNTSLMKDRLRWKEMATPKPAKVSEVQSIDRPVGQLSKPLTKMAGIPRGLSNLSNTLSAGHLLRRRVRAHSFGRAAGNPQYRNSDGPLNGEFFKETGRAAKKMYKTRLAAANEVKTQISPTGPLDRRITNRKPGSFNIRQLQ